jgi:hypothetical protein
MKLGAQPGTLFWNRMMMVGVIVTPLFIYLFVSIFTDTLSFIGSVPVVGVAAVLLWANFNGYVVRSAAVAYDVLVQADGKTITQTRFVYELGNWIVITYVLMFFIVVSVVRKAHSVVVTQKIEYSRVRPILYGTIISFLSQLANALPEIGRYPIDILGCLILGLLIFYAIYRNRMLEMRFMLTRGLVFYFFTAILTGMYVFLVYNIDKLLRSISSPRIRHVYPGARRGAAVPAADVDVKAFVGPDFLQI